MQKPALPAKPPIPTKPRNVQKTNYVVIAPHSEFNLKTPPPPPPRHQPQNYFIPSTPPTSYQIPYHHQQSYLLSSSLGECTNNVQHRQNYDENTISNGATETNGSRHLTSENIDVKSPSDNNKSYNHTPSHSFDSSSSSSGGFRDVDFVAKAKAIYEMHDKNNSIDHHETTHQQQNIGHSKVQEIQSRLLQHQQQIIQNHANNEEPMITINRKQLQKSTQELEKLLGMRVAASEKEIRQHQKVQSFNQEKPVLRMLSKGSDDEVDHCSNSLASQLTLNISKQIQQKLQQEMKQQCEAIKEKYLIEKIPVQQHYYMVLIKKHAHYFKANSFNFFLKNLTYFSNEVSNLFFLILQNSRNQPAIGLKPTAKRVSHKIRLDPKHNQF